MEEMDKNEYTELEEKDLEAVSGGCGTTCGFTCLYCGQHFDYASNHMVNVPKVGARPVCDPCWEQKKQD